MCRKSLSSRAPPLPAPTDRSSRPPIPVTCPALWEQHFDGKIYEESNYCCWEGIKTIFHSPRPRATSAGATWGALCTSHPSLWPAITGTDYSCNSLLIGSGTEMAINARLSACLPSRGCHQHRPRRAGGTQWAGPFRALPAALALARALKLGTPQQPLPPTSSLPSRLLLILQCPTPMPPPLGSLL